MTHVRRIDRLVLQEVASHSHRKCILHGWRNQISDGLIGGIDSLIHTVISMARDFRNPSNLISIAYLIAGKLDFTSVPVWIPSPI